ncbi:TRAP transporter small permease [Nitratireductor sp. ZSWI3]|uniref:TRAP transporter small permease n=1 Tax=Nitratireductor sp. ZSWI3 TaxID=2966359 RepID=UPI0021500F43|nr:TRAP transporter small permease [Nitratireductor sp. ZSWI3]MCR4267554.1 TRAP transporter small permease [Nitratireductor sp. ZSWI3]
MLRRIERLLLDLSICAIAGLCLLITASVVLRAGFNSGVPDTVVMVGELMVAAIVLPLATATAARSHIGVEFVANMLSPRAQGVLIVFGSVVGLLALAPLLYAGWREAAHTLTNGAFFFGQLSLPKWPGRVIFLTGLSFCWLRLLLLVINDTVRLSRGENLADLVHSSGRQGER